MKNERIDQEALKRSIPALLFLAVALQVGAAPIQDPPGRTTDEATLFEAPPAWPPGSPASQSTSIFQGDLVGVEPSPKAGSEAKVNTFSGEFDLQAVDLRIKGRGLDFIWARRYRSRVGPNTAMGNGWDFSYNIRVERKQKNIIVHDGNTRRDVFALQPDGTYAADQFFREGLLERGARFVLTFADGGRWVFRPLDDLPAQGRIDRIVDRNGNALSFEYDEIGRLAHVIDTLGRPIAIAYDGDGFIESLTDFTGREVRYAYYRDGQTGGSFGDLKSATSPAVTGTPHGNDFPEGKTTTYTYAKGARRADLNGNLLSITDSKNQRWLTVGYFESTDPKDVNFDRVRTLTLGNAGETSVFSYLPRTPSAANAFSVLRTIVNDHVGNVSEHFYDAMNRRVMHRQFTGRAVPGHPTTETANRPTGKLRASDPDFFETRWERNIDSLPTRVVFPNGTTVQHTFELTPNPSAPRRHRGDLRERRVVSPDGTSATVQSYQYDPRFGSDPHAGPFELYDYPGAYAQRVDGIKFKDKGFGFVVMETDERGNETRHSYDASGNWVRTVHRIPAIVEDFEYNEFGQLVARVLPEDGADHRRRDVFTYHTTGFQTGYLRQRIIDADPGRLNLTTTFEYDAVGNVTRIIDPRRYDRLLAYNQLDQLVRAESRPAAEFRGLPVRYTRLIYYDANNNLVRACQSNQDENGVVVPGNAYLTTLYEYDGLNRLLRMCRESGSFDVPDSPPQLDCSGLPESEFATTEFEYDANGNLRLVRFPEAVAGRDPFNVVEWLHDERDLRFRQILAPGHPAQSTSQFDYNLNGLSSRVLQGLEGTARETHFAYDGFNRPGAVTDPMGNVTSYAYDARGNLLLRLIDGELADAPGGGNNVRLAETLFVYDAMDRLVRHDRRFFDPVSQTEFSDGAATTTWTYNGLSQVLTATDDHGGVNSFQYDTAGRLQTALDPRGNSASYAYDENGNLLSVTTHERSDLRHPGEVFTTAFAYDALDRRISTADNVGNTTHSQYNSRNNVVRTFDALGIETRYEFDGLNRQVAAIRNVRGGGAPGDAAGPIIVGSVWNASSRLVQQIDDNGNATHYRYDPLGRLTRVGHADGTQIEFSYDPHHNLTRARDPNGSVVLPRFDALNRLIRLDVSARSGVATDTTFSEYGYDGRSQLVRAADDDSLVTFAHDSLGNVLHETLNGEATSYSYDSMGNETKRSYPGGRQLEFRYDVLNRLAGASDSDGVIAGFDYVGSRVERRALGNGTESLYLYDGVTGSPNPDGDAGVKKPIAAVYRMIVTGDVGGTWDVRQFAWDANQNVRSQSNGRPRGPDFVFQHNQTDLDFAQRLVRSTVTDSAGSILRQTEYTLDGVGNRLEAVEDRVPQMYALDATVPNPADFQMNQYTVTPFDLRQYDANGNPTVIDGLQSRRLLVYDAAGRLVRHTDTASGTEATYAYDALGRRIGKTVRTRDRAQTTRFFWSGWRLIEEQNERGATLATYVHGPTLDDMVEMQRAGRSFFFHHDGRWNVSTVTDSSGAVVERYNYGDFGETKITDADGNPRDQSVVGNPYRFNGRQYDDETGLYQYRARYYEPETGRFLTRNPLGAWFDAFNIGNGFTYVGNNPQTWSDPTGLPSTACPNCSIKNANFAIPSAASTGINGQQLFFTGKLAVQPAPATGEGPVYGSPPHILFAIPSSSTSAETGTREVGSSFIGGARVAVADFNLDGDIDGADSVVWRSSVSGVSTDHSFEIQEWFETLSKADTARSHHPDFFWIPVSITHGGEVNGGNSAIFGGGGAGLLTAGSTVHDRSGSAVIRGLFSLFGAAAPYPDGAILVVSALDGPMPYWNRASPGTLSFYVGDNLTHWVPGLTLSQRGAPDTHPDLYLNIWIY